MGKRKFRCGRLMRTSNLIVVALRIVGVRNLNCNEANGLYDCMTGLTYLTAVKLNVYRKCYIVLPGRLAWSNFL